MNKTSLIKNVGCGTGVTAMEGFMSDPHIFTGHKDRSVRMYSSRENHTKPIYEFKNLADQEINSLRLSSNELYLLITSREGNAINVMDIRNHKII